jgi:hypothetical protein
MGEAFVGTCILCGKRGLKMSQANEPCQNPAGVSREHAFLDAIVGPEQPLPPRKDEMPESDIIGGFPVTSDYCAGCGRPLLIENAWMTDGCPCNSRLGVNSLNETRWRRLMELQQRQARIVEQLPRTADGVPIVPGMTVWCRVGPYADERKVVAPYGKVALLTREPARHGACEGDSHRLAETVYSTREAALAKAAPQSPGVPR